MLNFRNLFTEIFKDISSNIYFFFDFELSILNFFSYNKL